MSVIDESEDEFLDDLLTIIEEGKGSPSKASPRSPEPKLPENKELD